MRPGSPQRGPTHEDLLTRIAKLERINAALMAHVERATDQSAGAYSLFQTAILLEGRVRSRTEELTAVMHRLERSNAALQIAKEEAERANLSKTRFLAAASHDLLQPLNAARLSSSALAGLALPEEARGLAGQVERGLQTIEDLIKTLLDISKLDAGVVTPQRVPLALRQTLADVADEVRADAEGKGLRLVLRCADLTIDSDPVLLKRILRNLVSNAIRYTTHGGVLLAGRRRGGGAEVCVIDTGIGIPEAERDLIFEEFYRGRSATGTDAGLGLGLSIVRRMTSALTHPLSLRSRPGHGSAFRLHLPLSAQPPAGLPGLPPAETTLRAAEVLIVENDPATRTALAQLLRGWGLNVILATGDGRIAPDARPDLVIADYHLDAGATGLDVIAALRARRDREAATLPCVVTTADHSAAIAQAVKGAACELMHKPVKPAHLRALVSYLLPG